MTCRWFHRWTRWRVEYEECPDGHTGVWQYRVRRCRRPGCDMFEEEGGRRVSVTAALLLMARR